MSPRRSLISFCLALAALALPALVSPARASAVTGLDVMTSTVLQEGQSSFSGLGVRLRLRSAQLVEGIEFLPAIEYWRNHTSLKGFGIESSRRDATLLGEARYTFRSAHWSPYAGVGFGLHFLSSTVDAPSFGINRQERSLIKGGPCLLGGATFPITKAVDSFADLEYHHVTDYRQLKINWGLSFSF